MVMPNEQGMGAATLDVARLNLGEDNVNGVIVEPAIDDQGNEAVRVTVVLRPGAAERIKGDQALGFLSDLRDKLWESGEQRLPLLSYATEEELAQSHRDEELEESK